MRVLIIAAGKLKSSPLRVVLDDYLKRIGRYAACRELEIKDGAPEDVDARMRKAIPERSRVVALEVDGRAWSSERLAAFLDARELDGTAHLVWLVGGADGLPDSLSRDADLRLSLSPMTLPHRLARVVLAEQIYRAFTISRNEPYAH